MPKRKHIIYGNCRVHHPDGSLMFLCIEKRAKWYLDRDLAIVLSEEPLTIQLTFEPQGKGAGEGKTPEEISYLLGIKENRCVVCGNEKLSELTKHHIVPREYRKYFPVSYKERASHDVVCICRKDHDVYENNFADPLKRELEEKVGIDLVAERSRLSKMRSTHNYAKILMDPDLVLRIPESRINFFLTEIEEVFGKKSLKEITEIDYYKYFKEKNLELSKKVVDTLQSESEIQEFVFMWRRHFLESMQPQFLPKGWSVSFSLTERR